MASDKMPSTMRAWQFSSIAGGLEKNLKLQDAIAIPKPKSDQHLVRVLAASLNPVDYKVAEVGMVFRTAFPKPSTPCTDLVGRIIRPAPQSGLKEGDVVYGASFSPTAAGALAEYAVVPAKSVVRAPEGLSMADAASIPVAGLTAYQSLAPYLKEGSRVFINGGSGGVGSFAIQFAKQHHAHVTASCSTTNIELCKSLGADEVLDYKESPILEQLQARHKNGLPFDLVVDNVGKDQNLFWKLHTYSSPSARYIFVGFGPSLDHASFVAKAKLIGVPGFLGGSKRTLIVMTVKADVVQLENIGKWLVEGKIKSTVGKKFKMEEAVEAFQLMKSGRSKGKIIIEME